MTGDLAAFLDAVEARLAPRAYNMGASSYEVLADPDADGINWPDPSPYWDDPNAPDVRVLVAMVRAVLATCDDGERRSVSRHYGGDFLSLSANEVRAALSAALPPTPTAEETQP